MKVIKENPIKSYTQRLRQGLLSQLELEAKRHRISRNELIEAILEKAMADPGFIVRIKK